MLTIRITSAHHFPQQILNRRRNRTKFSRSKPEIR